MVSTVDPRTFALSSQGQSVALRVVDANSNNVFDGSDFVEFFGQKFRSTLSDLLDRQMEEKYTDEQVYWLDIGGAAGPRGDRCDRHAAGEPDRAGELPDDRARRGQSLLDNFVVARL